MIQSEEARHWFQNRSLLIATKHQKEKVIAPLMQDSLGVKSIVAEKFDTDVLGTFSGEIEREHDPLTTLRMKCQMAMELYQGDLCIASEGSFGAHPTLLFIPANDELVMLLDQKNGLEIVERELSVNTNFNGASIQSTQELVDFANTSLFPSHALILRNQQDSQELIYKGITEWPVLLQVFEQIREAYGTAYVETDMRAMYNPTRMEVIKKATQKLLQKVNSLCPACQTPGFGVTEAKAGLPCSWCKSPTRSTLSYVYTCSKCQYTSEKRYPHDRQAEDPTYCDHCNP